MLPGQLRTENDIFIKRLSLFQRFTLSWNYCMIQTEETETGLGQCLLFSVDRVGDFSLIVKLKSSRRFVSTAHCCVPPVSCLSSLITLHWTSPARNCPCYWWLVTLLHWSWPFPPRQDVPRPSNPSPRTNTRQWFSHQTQRILPQVSLLKWNKTVVKSHMLVEKFR